MSSTAEKISVMQAFEDGKLIQIKGEAFVDWTDWEADYSPSWNWRTYNYRIKPEEKKPEYRPYKDTEEMIEDFKKRFRVIYPTYSMPMPLIWVRLSNTEDVRMWLITEYGDNFVVMANSSYAMHRLFQEFTYLDGSPCGKLVEE